MEDDRWQHRGEKSRDRTGKGGGGKEENNHLVQLSRIHYVDIPASLLFFFTESL